MNLNDPRLTLRTSSHYVAVAATGIPLSERFGKVPSHNLLRPNMGVQRVVEGLQTRRIGEEEPVLRNPRLAEALGPAANKLSVLKAAKDAEILRLKAELQNAHRQLGTGGGRGGRVSNNSNRNGHASHSLKTIQKQGGGAFISKHRYGGGITVDRRGVKQGAVQLRNQQVLELLEPSTSTFGRSPLKRAEKKGNGSKRGKFFGTPKTKSALDNELDAYMNKSKSNLESNLDKELDEYMSAAARARAKALGTVNEVKPASPENDNALTIVESDELEDPVVEPADNLDIEMDE